MKRISFYVLREKNKQFYKMRVSGVEFTMFDTKIYAYIDINIHRIYFVDPGTGIAFARYTFPFERNFNTERHLCRAPLYLNNEHLMDYVKFLSLGEETEEKEHYRKLCDFFAGGKI